MLSRPVLYARPVSFLDSVPPASASSHSARSMTSLVWECLPRRGLFLDRVQSAVRTGESGSQDFDVSLPAVFEDAPVARHQDAIAEARGGHQEAIRRVGVKFSRQGAAVAVLCSGASDRKLV